MRTTVVGNAKGETSDTVLRCSPLGSEIGNTNLAAIFETYH